MFKNWVVAMYCLPFLANGVATQMHPRSPKTRTSVFLRPWCFNAKVNTKTDTTSSPDPIKLFKRGLPPKLAEFKLRVRYVIIQEFLKFNNPLIIPSWCSQKKRFFYFSCLVWLGFKNRQTTFEGFCLLQVSLYQSFWKLTFPIFLLDAQQ